MDFRLCSYLTKYFKTAWKFEDSTCGRIKALPGENGLFGFFEVVDVVQGPVEVSFDVVVRFDGFYEFEVEFFVEWDRFFVVFSHVQGEVEWGGFLDSAGIYAFFY